MTQRGTLNLADALTVYEARRDWYPEAPAAPAKPTQEVASVLDIASQYDLILFDSYGVLKRGEQVISTAHGVLAALREQGTLFHVLSNDARATAAGVLHYYQALNFDLTADEITTSLDAALGLLGATHGEHPNWAVLQAPTAGTPLHEKTRGMHVLEAHDWRCPERIHTLFFQTNGLWTAEQQAALCQELAGRELRLVVANPDVVAPSGDLLYATPGYYVHDLAQVLAPTSTPPIIVGKPGALIYQQALAKLGLEAEAPRVLMVGDTLHTDILGGAAMGFDTLLVRSGLLHGEDAIAVSQQCGIFPTYIADRI